MSDAIEIIQTDTKSFFASCNICGEGVTADTRKKSDRWANNHAPADVAYLLAELRKAHEALRVARFVASEWEAELLDLKGPCRAPGCRLHYAHRGPCAAVAAAKGSE